jgi:hypothetical protein
MYVFLGPAKFAALNVNGRFSTRLLPEVDRVAPAARLHRPVERIAQRDGAD